jgi:hypothetical protein
MKKALLLIIALVFTGFYSFAQWTTQNPLPTGNSLRAVYFPDANTGYAVGMNGIILKTIDAGTNWVLQASGTTNNLKSVFFTDANNGYVVGDHGTILKTTNGGYGLGINNNLQTNSLKFYPNPATEKINIELSEPGSNMNGTISIYEMTGQEMIRKQVTGSKVEINVSSLPGGIYLVKLIANKKIEVGKFVKE